MAKNIEGNVQVKVQSGNSTSDHNYSTQEDQADNDVNNQGLAPGFRMNIDHLDYKLNVRNMTVDHQNKSHHCVQVVIPDYFCTNQK